MMKMQRTALAICALTAVLALAGCGTRHVRKKAAADDGSTASIVLSEELFALVLPRHESSYDDDIVTGYETILELAGRNYKVYRPGAERPSADQLNIIRDLIAEHVSVIAVAPVDPGALEEELILAMNSGIDVCAFDRPASPSSRELYINPAGSDQTAATLLEAVSEITGGEGQWALISGNAVSDSQDGREASMRKAMKEPSYSGLELLEIAYGNDSYQTSYQQTKALLQNYPDIEVIVSTSDEGLRAAAAAVTDAESDVKVTGFGLPSDMEEYIVSGVCPFFYLRDPQDTGKMTAYVSIALRDNMLTGAKGESFRAGDGEYVITEAADKGTEVISGSPIRIDSGSIDKWIGHY